MNIKKHSISTGKNLILWLGCALLSMTSLHLRAQTSPTVTASVSTQGNHTLFMDPEGAVWGLGTNANGQLGDGTTVSRVGVARVMSVSGPLTGAVEIGCGASHSVVLKSDGTVWATGLNSSGQLGNGMTKQSTKAAQVLTATGSLTGIRSIAAGSYHNLALASSGEVWAWGNNSAGQLGIGTLINNTRAVKIPGLTGVVAIAAGEYHSYAVKSDGTVWAFGKNAYGQLGANSTIAAESPVQVLSGTMPLTGVISAAAGQNHGLFLQSSGTVWAVGLNSSGQLGDGTATQRLTAVKVLGAIAGFSSIVDLAAGSAHSVFLKSDGTVWCAGNNSFGQLGDGTISNRTKAVKVPVSPDVSLIAAGAARTFAVNSDGSIVAWGENIQATLGAINRGYLTAWANLPSLAEATQAASSAVHTLILDSDGTVWGAGKNNCGQLGNGLTSDSNALVQVLAASGPLGGIRALTVGSSHSLALRTDGTVWAWGNNANGRLGDGTTTRRTKAVSSVDAIAPLSGVSAIASGDAFNLALRQGTVLAWGSNAYGQLGDGTTTDKTKAVTVQSAAGPMSGITAIAAGATHCVALKGDGTVWVWGLNSGGQLGLGNTTTQPVAVQIPGVMDACAIAAGAAQTYILRANGTLWAAGQNNVGQLADGTWVNRSTLVQVQGPSGALTGLTWVLGGSLAHHASAGRPDGATWFWGYNDLGQLGNSSTANASKAVLAPAGIRPMALGAKNSFGICADSQWVGTGSYVYGQMSGPWIGYFKQAIIVRAMTFALRAPDADNDGIPDWVEISQGTNPDAAASSGGAVAGATLTTGVSSQGTGSATLAFNAGSGNLSAGNLTLKPTGGTVTITGGTITFDQKTGTLTVSGSSSTASGGSLTTGSNNVSTGALTMTGAGTPMLSGTDTIAGSTVANAGSLSLGGGVLAVPSNVASGSVTINAGVSNATSGSLTIGNNNVSTGALTMGGAGTPTLSVTDTIAGSTIVNAGSLSLGTGVLTLPSNVASGSATLNVGESNVVVP